MPLYTPDYVIKLASPLDLLITKVKVILQRIEVKNYRDIAVICKAGISFSNAFGAASLMFPDFNPIFCAKTITFLKEII
jgi:hypothetical protein